MAKRTSTDNLQSQFAFDAPATSMAIQVSQARSPLKDTREQNLLHVSETNQACPPSPPMVDLADILGQAAAGGHSLLLSGPPGFGKTMLAHALADMLAPPLLFVTWAFETAKDGSSLDDMFSERLAQGGILFLDDLAALRPAISRMLSRMVEMRRAQQSAPIMLIAEARPCPCGYYDDAIVECRCSSAYIQAYQARLAPFVQEHLDMWVEVPCLDMQDMLARPAHPAERSLVVKKRVLTAQSRQDARFQGKETRILRNAEMGPNEVQAFCQVDPAGEKLLRAAIQQLHLSARSYHRMLKLTRTIADLADSEQIMANHLAEAIQYRPPIR